jgi:[NiFe] hydrogenase diaphorase moiety large subunit
MRAFMNGNLEQVVKAAASRCGNDRTRLMDVVREVQAHFGGISKEAMGLISRELSAPRVDVEAVVSFYAFLSEKELGKKVVRLSECVACAGADGPKTAALLQKALGIGFGQTTPDGEVTLERTSCVGLCDQGPAALVDGVLVAGLTPNKVKRFVTILRGQGGAKALAPFAPENNVRKSGEVILSGMALGAGLKQAVAREPAAVLAELKASKLRGRGGAGFPTSSKWEFARSASGAQKVMICNADEGEPGTFKDRAILNLVPELVFEGMAIGGYAVGASEGVLYLRGEYEMLQPCLEKALAKMRSKGLLGRDVAGKQGFHFDIRIQMGAGAYVCGEESALISSCEGKRGVPKDRPPFPVEKGYLDRPTAVNNVETFCCVARILEKGAAWFSGFGTSESTGTKLLSVSGDCKRPGIYELPFGMTLADFLKEVGGAGAKAVLVGGPSGTFVNPAGFGRRIGFEDLPTGGSMMVFGKKRDLLEVASSFMHFFVEESCGWCTPCRVGNVLLKERLDRIRAREGAPEDLKYLEELCATVKKTSRCGLGQTSPNPVHSTLVNFRPLYEAKLPKATNGTQPSFDLKAALADAVQAQGRKPIFHQD